jgi:RHS repeat-associated protein
LTATNPESGQISYTYDANGNVLTRTDARGVVTNYSPSGYGIDALNRVQKKTYSDATLAVTYTYDTVKLGRLSSVSNSVSTTNYTAYDGLGRVTAGNQNTGGTAYPFGYGYNALGLTSMTYPSGRSVSYTYDGAGRTLTAAGTLGSETHTYASEVIYEPHGGMHEWRRTYTPSGGSQYNIVEDHTYNSRLQPATVSLTANSTQRLALGFDYGTTGNNGNLLQQTITVPGASPASQIYSYDAVNRLSGASEGSAWSRTFGYDAYGNMWVSAASGIPAASFTPQSSAWFGANNRLVNQSLSIQYDGGGSLTQIGGYGFTYDAEGRLKTSTVNSIATEYFYDGEGRRVKKTTDGNTTVYAYDAFGKLAAQYGGTADGGGTQYLTTDHLGSTRLVTDTAGSPVKRYDFLPFGEEIPSGIGFRTAGLGYAADSFSLKFTGKERDAETGLDWFETRYLSGAQGRFTSPDSYNIVHEMLKGRDANEQQQILIGYISNPQVWNKYAYVLNNPLKYSDPDGRREESEEDKKRLALLQQYAQQSGDKALQAAANQATAEIKAAIAAVPEGQKKDPAGLAAALWSLGQLGNTAWGRQGSVDNGVTAPLGPETNKCTTFVATAYGEGAGVGFGGSGFPVGGRSATTFFWRRNVVSANTLASTTALPSLSIVSSPQLGGVVAFLNGGMGAGHSGIYIGGGAIAYAGKEAGKAQTIQYNVQHLQPAPAAIRYRIYKP